MECNIRRAEVLALQVWQAGAACICPHTNTRFYQGAAPDAVWLDGDLEILRRCDAVVTTANWDQSHGASIEVAMALDTLWIPVFHASCVNELYISDEGPDYLPPSFMEWVRS